jgi:peptide/nickel transport system substrate-binding protein
MPDAHRALFQVEAKDMEPLPNLAKSWSWSDDGKVLTMKLIEGAKWSDGDPSIPKT